MLLALVLLLAAIPGDDAAAPADAPQFACEVRYLSFGSPQWRGELLPGLRSLERRGSAAAWTIDDPTASRLLEMSGQGEAGNHLIASPKAMVSLGESAHLAHERDLNYVANLRREADGPPGESSRLTFAPEVDQIHEGVRVDLTGTKSLDTGVFARVAVEEDRLIRFQTATYGEDVRRQIPVESRPKSGHILVDRLFRSVGIKVEMQAVKASLQVPEVASSRIAGEWLIPRDGAVLVSLGAGTERDESDTMRYVEHLVIITCRPLGQEPAVPQD